MLFHGQHRRLVVALGLFLVLFARDVDSACGQAVWMGNMAPYLSPGNMAKKTLAPINLLPAQTGNYNAQGFKLGNIGNPTATGDALIWNGNDQGNFNGIENVATFGADPTGVANSAAAFNSATASFGAGGGIVEVPAGTYRLNTQVSIPAGVSIQCDGPPGAVVLDIRGTAGFVGSAALYHQRFTNCNFSLANNSNSNVNMFDAQFGSNASVWENNIFTSHCSWNGSACANTGQNGLIIRGCNDTSGATCAAGGAAANNSQYNNVFFNDRFLAATGDHEESGGIGLYLFGQSFTNQRANGNRVIAGVYGGFATGLWVDGNGNSFDGFDCPGPNATACVTIDGDSQASANVILNGYVDGGVTGSKVQLNQSMSGFTMMAWITNTINVRLPSDVVTGGTNPTKALFAIKGDNQQFQDGTVFTSTDAAQTPTYSCIQSTGLCFYSAQPTGTGVARAGMLTSGDTFAGSISGVSNNGGVSNVMNDDASAQWRVVKHATSTPGTYTQLAAMNNAGLFSLLTGAESLAEIGNPSGASGKDIIWGDSTAHRLMVNNNNGGATNVLTAAAGNGQAAVWSGASATIVSSATDFFGFGQSPTLSVQATEANTQLNWPLAGTASNLQCFGTTAAQAGGVVYTVDDNTSAQTLTCTMTNLSPTSCSDTTHTFAVAAGDKLTVKVVNSNAANATGLTGCSFLVNG